VLRHLDAMAAGTEQYEGARLSAKHNARIAPPGASSEPLVVVGPHTMSAGARTPPSKCGKVGRTCRRPGDPKHNLAAEVQFDELVGRHMRRPGCGKPADRGKTA